MDMLFLSPQQLPLLSSTAAPDTRFEDTPEHRPLFYAIFTSSSDENDALVASASVSGSVSSAEKDKEQQDAHHSPTASSTGKCSSRKVQSPTEEKASLRRRQRHT